MTSQALNRPVDVREQFESAVRQWPNYSERTLARDGRYPEYYGNPVVQGAWEGWKAAMRSPTVVELIEADREFDAASLGYNPLFADSAQVDRYHFAVSRRAAALAAIGSAK